METKCVTCKYCSTFCQMLSNSLLTIKRSQSDLSCSMFRKLKTRYIRRKKIFTRVWVFIIIQSASRVASSLLLKLKTKVLAFLKRTRRICSLILRGLMSISKWINLALASDWAFASWLLRKWGERLMLKVKRISEQLSLSRFAPKPSCHASLQSARASTVHSHLTNNQTLICLYFKMKT